MGPASPPHGCNSVPGPLQCATVRHAPLAGLSPCNLSQPWGETEGPADCITCVASQLMVSGMMQQWRLQSPADPRPSASRHPWSWSGVMSGNPSCSISIDGLHLVVQEWVSAEGSPSCSISINGLHPVVQEWVSAEGSMLQALPSQELPPQVWDSAPWEASALLTAPRRRGASLDLRGTGDRNMRCELPRHVLTDGDRQVSGACACSVLCKLRAVADGLRRHVRTVY